MGIFIVFEKKLWYTIGIILLLCSFTFYYFAMIDFRKKKNYFWILMITINYGIGELQTLVKFAWKIFKWK